MDDHNVSLKRISCPTDAGIRSDQYRPQLFDAVGVLGVSNKDLSHSLPMESEVYENFLVVYETTAIFLDWFWTDFASSRKVSSGCLEKTVFQALERTTKSMFSR